MGDAQRRRAALVAALVLLASLVGCTLLWRSVAAAQAEAPRVLLVAPRSVPRDGGTSAGQSPAALAQIAALDAELAVVDGQPPEHPAPSTTAALAAP